MNKKAILAALLCLPASALDNSITIHEASGAVQIARPVTVYRSFAQGEFPSGSYPKPRLGGIVAGAWQVDIKTTWPDGSVQMAYVSFRLDLPANGSANVDFIADPKPCHLGDLATCQAAALTQAQMLGFDTGGGSGSWSATWYGTINSIQFSASARAMLNAGAWRYQLRGPVVSGVIVEDRSTSLAFDFGWTYDSGTSSWTAPAAEMYKSIHPVYELRFYPDPDGPGPLTAWNGVEVDAQLWNASTTRYQKFNPIDLVLKTGLSEGDTAYSVTGKVFHPRSRRHKLTWSGTAPGAVVIDFNFRYLIHTKLIGPYDYSLPVANTLADATIGSYNANLGPDEPQWCSNSAFCANWRKSVGTTGARGEIALIARWYLNYLYLMGHDGLTVAKKLEIWDKTVIGNADAGGHAPIHYFETATGLTFFSIQDTSDAFGRVASINARPSWNAGGTTERTYMPPVCTIEPCDGRGGYEMAANTGGWTAYGSTNYNSHAPSFYSIPAFLTGYHYYLTGVQMEAAYMLATENSCTNAEYCRHQRWGIFYYDAALRETAWALRNITWAAILTPDGDIEKQYFREKLVNNARFTEGVMLLADGAHPPADPTCASYVRSDAATASDSYDLWCAGRYWWINAPGGLLAANPLRVATAGYLPTSSSDGWVPGARRATGYWQSYLGVSWGWIASSGAFLDAGGQPLFKHIRDAHAAHFAGRALSSAKSMYLLRDTDWGYGGTGAVCTSFEDCAASWAANYTLGEDMTSAQTTLVIDSTEIRSTGDNWLHMSWMKIGSEYVRLSGAYTLNSPSAGKTTISIAGRGVWGSQPASHPAGSPVEWLPGPWMTYSMEFNGGYPVLARAAMAMMHDADKVGAYSPGAAYHVFQGSLPHQNYSSNPLWAFVPRESISNVQVSGTGGSVLLRWTAPSAAACRVYLGITPPPGSSDAGDGLATAPGRSQRYQAAGLGLGLHHYRITCGTARASGTVFVTN